MVMWDPAKIRREKDKQEEQDYNDRFNQFKIIARIKEQRKQKEQAIEKSKMGGGYNRKNTDRKIISRKINLSYNYFIYI